MSADAQLRTFAQYQGSSRFLELDGYRGLGVLLVIAQHLKTPILAWANPYGAMTVFFLVSGFVITTLALREESRHGRISLVAFYVRRAMRILPPYFVVLGLYCALILGFGIGAEKAESLRKLLPAYLLYYQELPFFLPERFGVTWGSNVPFYQSWSLGIEEKFYVLWPLIAFVAFAGWGAWRAGIAMLLGLLAAAAPLLGREGECVFPYWNILCGCALAVLLHDRRGYEFLAKLARPRIGAVVLTLALLVHLAGARWHEIRFVHPVAMTLGIVVLLVADGPLQRVLRHPATVFLGTLSYGIYLLHLLAINAAERLVGSFVQGPLANLLTFAMAIALAATAAALLHRVVERPCIELGRAWSARFVRR